MFQEEIIIGWKMIEKTMLNKKLCDHVLCEHVFALPNICRYTKVRYTGIEIVLPIPKFVYSVILKINTSY